MDDLRKALFRALEKGDINMLRDVLERGATLDHQAGDPDPVYFIPAQYDGIDLPLLQFLLAAGADLSAREPEYQDTLLHWCVNDEDAALLPWLIAQGLDVNARNIKGRTAAAFTVFRRDATPEYNALGLRDLKLLIAAGADVRNIEDDGTTLLHTAAFTGSAERVSLLLAHGADVMARQTNGQTPLHLVAEGYGHQVTPEHMDVIDLLLAAGADIEALDNDNQPPLSCTPSGGNMAVAVKLLDCGADINGFNGGAVRSAVAYEQAEMLTMLLDRGADFERPQEDEQLRPLGLAAHVGYADALRILLDRGADIEAETIDGETPLLIAVRRQNHDCVALLLERGAERYVRDHYDNTPMSWARRCNDARLIEMLSQ